MAKQFGLSQRHEGNLMKVVPLHVAKHLKLCEQIDYIMQCIEEKKREIHIACALGRKKPQDDLKILHDIHHTLWESRSHFIAIGFDYPYCNPPARSDTPIRELAYFEVTEHVLNRVVHPTIILQLGDLVYHEFNIPTAIERNGKILWERQ